jgi:carbon monoxide dehydrogenase subunit G
MDMQGQRTLACTQQQAWDALNQPEILKACIPGCEKFEATADGYAVTTAIKIGPVSARFSGKVQLTDVNAPHGYQLNFEAQGGVAGFGKGQSRVELKPVDAGCELSYTVHSTVGGKLAQLGQRLVDGAAKSLADDFFKRFDAQLQALYPPIEAQASAQEAVPVTDTTADSERKQSVPTWFWAGLAVAALGLAWVIIS